jgi:hypothetical protein
MQPTTGLLIVAAVEVALSLPLILGRVPPNYVYGLRTYKTLAKPEIWYRANAFAGTAMLAAGLCTAAAGRVLRLLSGGASGGEEHLAGWATVAGIVPPLLAGVVSIIYASKL